MMALYSYLLIIVQIGIICGSHYIETLRRDFSSKIVSGEPVDIRKFPHAVIFINDVNLCGGSILNKKIVVTAAHCFDNNKDSGLMFIQSGNRTLNLRAKRFDVQDFIIHKDYGKTHTFGSDIALLLIRQEFTYRTEVRKASIVNHAKWMNTNETFLVAGWGVTEQGGPISKLGLLYTTLHYVPSNTCVEMNNLPMTTDMFCLYGDGERDACQGDSGGGVLWKGMLVGLVSFGDGCGQTNKPGIYTNVYYFRKWIYHAVHYLEKIYCNHPSPAQLNTTAT